MTQAKIVVDTDSIAASSFGPATGGVWIEIGSEAFPCEDWSDFVVVVLETMVTAVVRLLSGASDKERIHFMEGPYALDLSRLPGRSLQVHAIERRRTDVVQASMDIGAGVFAEELLGRVEQVVTVCRERDIWSDDADKLQAALAVLRGELLKL